MECTSHWVHVTLSARHIECTSHWMHVTLNARHVESTSTQSWAHEVEHTNFEYTELNTQSWAHTDEDIKLSTRSWVHEVDHTKFSTQSRAHKVECTKLSTQSWAHKLSTRNWHNSWTIDISMYIDMRIFINTSVILGWVVENRHGESAVRFLRTCLSIVHDRASDLPS